MELVQQVCNLDWFREITSMPPMRWGRADIERYMDVYIEALQYREAMRSHETRIGQCWCPSIGGMLRGGATQDRVLKTPRVWRCWEDWRLPVEDPTDWQQWMAHPCVFVKKPTCKTGLVDGWQFMEKCVQILHKYLHPYKDYILKTTIISSFRSLVYYYIYSIRYWVTVM